MVWMCHTNLTHLPWRAGTVPIPARGLAVSPWATHSKSPCPSTAPGSGGAQAGIWEGGCHPGNRCLGERIPQNVQRQLQESKITSDTFSIPSLPGHPSALHDVKHHLQESPGDLRVPV